MKNVLLLATGGTIASVPSENGLVPALNGEDLIKMVPGIKNLCRLDCKEIMSLDSSNIAPEHWLKIAAAVAGYYDQYDGIIITHGTDTMAYTCAALSAMLINVQKPVIVTGAQLSMIEEGTDAKNNLLHAVQAAVSDFKGVGLVFGSSFIHGGCARKMCTQNFEGFASINYPAIAELNEKGIKWLTEKHTGGAYGPGNFRFIKKLETKVCAVKITPGLSPEILLYLADKGYKGIILEGFGNGGVPNGDINWLPYLETVLKKGIRVFCASQCIYDGVNLDRYPIGLLAKRLGAESAGNLTTESLLVKLMVELAG